MCSAVILAAVGRGVFADLPLAAETAPAQRVVATKSRGSDPPDDSDALTDDEEEFLVEPLPFDKRVGQIVGVDVPTIISLLADRKTDLTIACISDRGYELGPAALAALRQKPSDSELPTYDGGVERVVEFWSTRDQFEEAGLLEPEFQTALDECTSEAAEMVGNPFAEYQEWYDQVSSDLASVVASDERYLAARDEEDRCLESMGLSEQNPDQLAYNLSRRAHDAHERHRDGEISDEDLRVEIAELQREEDVLAGQLDECVLPRLLVERRLMANLQDEYLDEHAATIAEFGEDVRDALEELGIVESG